MFLRDIKGIGKNEVLLAGGKGASLSELTRMGVSVPEAFVIISSVFDQFLTDTDLGIEVDSILKSANHQEMHTIENAAEKIQALITDAKIPDDIAEQITKSFQDLRSEYVAVRSSATAEDSASAAWAGQLESYLNTTEDTLLDNVKQCWASLFSPRAIYYRLEKGFFNSKISVAVIVQKMIEAEKSGIAFSVHPVTQDKNQLIIEAGFGLGEAIVSGHVTPDSYVVEKHERKIIDINNNTQTKALRRAPNGGNEWVDLPQATGEQQVLSDQEMLALTDIICDIEKRYGFPCDIEWAMKDGIFYILQTRPITTLK